MELGLQESKMVLLKKQHQNLEQVTTRPLKQYS
jgi:hypothetical protein